MARLASIVLCVAVGLVGCAPEIQNDWFTCDLSMGQGCPDGFVCSAGRCVTSAGGMDGGAGDAGGPACTPMAGCGPGEMCCEGACIETDSDPANCGGCGTACPGGVCRMGVCDPPCTSAAECDDGVECTVELCSEGGTCVAGGIVSGRCYIDGQCFMPDERNPDNPCLICGLNSSGWSQAPSGTSCGGTPECSSMICREGLCMMQPGGCSADTCEGAACVVPEVPCDAATCSGGACHLSGECIDDSGTPRSLSLTPGGTCTPEGRCVACGGPGQPCCMVYPALAGRKFCSGEAGGTCTGPCGG